MSNPKNQRLTNCSHRKCDETKPHCQNCLKLGQQCEGYGLRLSFDVDDDRNQRRVDANGHFRVAFIGKPRLKLAKKPRSPNSGSIGGNGGGSGTISGGVGGGAGGGVVANLVSQASLFDNLELLLNLPDLERMLAMDPVVQVPPHLEVPLPHELDVNLLPIPEPTSITPMALPFDRPRPLQLPLPPALPELPDQLDPNLTLSHEEENVALRHFFDTLLPMLDANPESPWPDLALKYCDFDIARLCLMALALVHMYELGDYSIDFYHKGLAYMNRVMQCLVTTITKQLTEDSRKSLVMLFVILVLIHVHVVFLCMEKGHLALSRYLFQVFGVICEDISFHQLLEQDPRKVAMMGYLLVYDTISAMVSPDARLPYCQPHWFGTRHTELLTLSLMGCPGEVFQSIHRICFLRAAVKLGADIRAEIAPIEQNLLNYRAYVPQSANYADAVKAAHCWALAGLAALHHVVGLLAHRYVNEFIDVYGLLDGTIRLVTQMVWPIHIMCIMSITQQQRERMMAFLLYQRQFTQMKQYTLMKKIVDRVWATGVHPDDATATYLPAGYDYLCI